MFERSQPPVRKISLTPMIDMVFLLLVFFMLTTTFQRNQATKLNVGSSTTVEAHGDTQLIVVTVHPGNRIGLMDRLYTMHDFRIGLHELLVQHGDKHQIVLQTTNDATVQNLVWVLDMVQGAGTDNVTIIDDMLGAGNTG